MNTSQSRTCQSCKSDFRIEPDDFAFYEKMAVPPPTFCPSCRLQRRLSFRNDRTLYKRPCGMCKKDMVTIYSPDKPYTVYCQPCWWSDKWSPFDYGREYDFSKPFFDQFKTLRETVPLPSLNTLYQTLVNSEYTNQVGSLKDCYLLFNSDYSENCAYGTEIEHSKDCFDNSMIDQCELCYGCTNCVNCYGAVYSEDCESSQNIWFSKNLVGCSDCVGCVDLNKKSYHIFNQPYSKEDYQAELKKMGLDRAENIQAARAKALEFFKSFPHKFRHGRQNNEVSGDYIENCNRVYHSFITRGAQDCKYCLWLVVGNNKDCWDFSEYGDNCERVYECMNSGGGIADLKFCYFLFSNDTRAEYCAHTYSSSDLFGCVSLRKGEYCILNKRYSKEEFDDLRAKIVEHMDKMPYTDRKGRVYRYGEFFPAELSPFGYNESTASEHFPLSKEEGLAQGYGWKDGDAREHAVTRKTEDLPATIQETDDTVLKEVIACEHEGKCAHNCPGAFRLIPPELQFYKRMNLPLPRQCFNCRHYGRLERRNPLKLFDRACACAGPRSEDGKYANGAKHFHGAGKCPNEFQTAYAPDRPEIVYCDSCYNNEVS